jgi:predicted ATPase
MLKRLYADNFRCLTNFEIKLDEANVLLGANGTGKTSVLTVLRRIQHLLVRGAKIDDVFPARYLTVGRDRKEQRFEIQICLGSQTYDYGLTVEHDRDRGKMRIDKEILEHDGRPIFEFTRGQAQLYHDDYEPGPEYPFDWTLSGIGTLHERPDNRKITQFRREIASYIIVNPCPPLYKPETRTEDEFLEPLMGNFVGWYRHYSLENMGSIGELFGALRESLPAFDSIRLKESGEDSRALKAVFHSRPSGTVDYGFDQLSDGQRALIALYSLILLAGDRRVSLFIDEPDNYLSLREIQPWLVQANERCGTALEQLVVVSHHPVIIDYMAGACGRWFSRDGDGPVRVSEEPPASVDGLSISETIARGWEK